MFCRCDYTTDNVHVAIHWNMSEPVEPLRSDQDISPDTVNSDCYVEVNVMQLHYVTAMFCVPQMDPPSARSQICRYNNAGLPRCMALSIGRPNFHSYA
ncbi:hypothetical protein SKAU_G00256440 [Synaphobranchus kaupii]|uniref:Uncharacterized protein n=1 Tax=Synaphobranchus kaupii TaxID=118154 RepID=A0A9Q1F3Z8_SYNKA|nr:hypothetical protein SKAU_G00256440 [Synaphobranchus kaupii]